MNIKKALDHLQGLLNAAKDEQWPLDRVHVIDGYLAAICDISGMEYGFSGTDIYLTTNGERTKI